MELFFREILVSLIMRELTVYFFRFGYWVDNDLLVIYDRTVKT